MGQGLNAIIPCYLGASHPTENSTTATYQSAILAQPPTTLPETEALLDPRPSVTRFAVQLVSEGDLLPYKQYPVILACNLAYFSFHSKLLYESPKSLTYALL